MKTLLLFVSLLALPAFAQTAFCKAGAPCSVRTLRSTLGGGTAVCAVGPNAQWAWDTGTSTSYFGWTTSGAPCAGTTPLISMSVNETVVSSNGTGGWRAGTLGFQAAAGSATAPTHTFTSDLNTGLYNPSADAIGIATAGARSFLFSSTAGTLEGTSSAAALTLTSNANLSTTGIVSLNGAAGIQLLTGALTPTTFQGAAQRINMDAATGRLYAFRASPSASAPPSDFAAGPHPVMEQRAYALDMGYESTASPTFYPVAPRVGGSSATVTVTDAAAASSATLGASPSQVDARGFVTTAAAGSRSLFTTTAFIRKVGHAPRWCQKVSLSTGSNIRVWAGMANADPGASDAPANGAVSFRYSTTAGDSKWQACYANGVSTTCVDTGVAPTTSTASYNLLCIDCREGMSTGCNWWVDGIARVRVTSGLPTGAPFFPYFSVEARSAATVTGYSGPMSVEVN